MRATLTEVLTDDAYAHMLPLGQRWADGVAGGARPARAAVARDPARLPGRVRVRPDAAARRARPPRPTTSTCRRCLHLHALNRGVLLTPFHNMALMAPATTQADVDAHTAAFDEVAGALVG